jgi:ABC-type iron transport system FetAB permease component
MILGFIMIGLGIVLFMTALMILKESNHYEKNKTIPITYANNVVKFDHKMLKRLSKNE